MLPAEICIDAIARPPNGPSPSEFGVPTSGRSALVTTCSTRTPNDEVVLADLVDQRSVVFRGTGTHVWKLSLAKREKLSATIRTMLETYRGRSPVVSTPMFSIRFRLAKARLIQGFEAVQVAVDPSRHSATQARALDPTVRAYEVFGLVLGVEREPAMAMRPSTSPPDVVFLVVDEPVVPREGAGKPDPTPSWSVRTASSGRNGCVGFR